MNGLTRRSAERKFFYLSRGCDGELCTEGPLTYAEMGAAAREGVVHEWTMFATEEAASWQVMGDHPDLYAQLTRDPSEHVAALKRMRTGARPAGATPPRGAACSDAASDCESSQPSERLSSMLLRKAMSASQLSSSQAP